jgi:hypothetical protein
MVWLVIIPSILIISLILLLDGGHFTYTLDDPYIHLALAKNIMLGTYGINPGEPAAPSSSILWPFLLAPFSVLPGILFELTPLVMNLLCFAGFICILTLLFEALPMRQRLFTIACVVLSLNVFGLVFNGMEHELQVLLVAFIVLCLIRKSYRYLYIAAIILPFVRYEGLAISVPVLVYTFYTVNRRNSLLALMVIAIGICSFSLWLHRQGLGYLPSSVLAKSNVAGVFSPTADLSNNQGTFSTATKLSRIQAAFSNIANLIGNLRRYGFMLPVIYFIGLYYWRRDRGIVLVVISATALHLLFGQSGWYGRYEVYWLAFIILLAVRAALNWLAVDHRALAVVPFAALLPFVFSELTYDTISVPLASSNIANQQARVAAIARAVGEPVAVDDLGLISLRSRVYVLDLWGLGSIAALKARQEGAGAAWIESAMHSKGIEYAFIYDDFFPDRPRGWIKVASLTLLEHRITSGANTVSFYATDRSSATKLREVIERYAARIDSGRVRLDISGPQPDSSL